MNEMHLEAEFEENSGFYGQPMKAYENWSDEISWLCIGDEIGMADGRLREAACQCSVAVVESAKYECRDQTLGDVFSSRTTDLTQSPHLKQAAADDSSDVLLHRQLSVKIDAEVTYDCD